MTAARADAPEVRRYRGRSFTVGDTVTVEGSAGVWRIAGFFGTPNRMRGHSPRPVLIADLVRVDRKWSAATSAYISLLRAVS